MSSYDLSAFDSPNFPPLVKGKKVHSHSSAIADVLLFVVGIDIVVNWNDVIRQTSLRKFKAHKGLPPILTSVTPILNDCLRNERSRR